ncbi:MULTISPECIES: hypothetical protein [unclassified Nonomuraea]|uniref:hypothetical protein n=1 Tax=unclassified Nonomuraea TaxID=2593643 RepID=UPI0035BF29F4
MVFRPRQWSRAGRVALLAWSCCVAFFFLLRLAVDYVTEGTEKVNAVYLTMRPLANIAIWFVGALVIRLLTRPGRSGSGRS